MNTKNYKIVAGPNRDVLFDACKYAYSKNSHVNVDFTIAISGNSPTTCIPMQVKDIKIVSISHEDGSGESFLLGGYCDVDLCTIRGKATYSHYRFDAYYDTRKRTGEIFIRLN